MIPKEWYENLWFRVLMRGVRVGVATIVAGAIHLLSGRPEALVLIPILMVLDKYLREKTSEK